MSVSREIEGQSIQSASSDNAVQVLLLAFNLRAGQPCSAVLIVRKDQNRQVSSTEPQVSNEFQLMQVYQTSTDRKDWNATRPHRLTRVITAAIGTQMGYLLGNPFGHRVIATPFQSERSQSSETSSRSKAHRRKRSKRDSHMLMRGTTAVDLVTIISLVTTGVVDLAATALTIKLNVPDKTN